MEKTLLDYWLILYRRKWIIVLIVLSSLFTAFVLSEILSPVYEAKAVFFVPARPDAVTFLASPGESIAKTPLVPKAAEEPHGPYIGILKSKAIAEVVQREFPCKSVNKLLFSDVDFKTDVEQLSLRLA